MRQPDLSFLVQRQESLGDDAPLPLLPQEPSFAPLEAVEAAAQLPQDDPLAILIAELRNYQAELEVQNQVLNYSQAVAESASERFEALFASVPLPLLVLDDAHDMVIQANAMALNAFQPQGSDRLLASFMPFVCPADRDRVQQAFTLARSQGKSEVHEMVFNLGNRSTMQGDLHIACIEVPRQDGPPTAQFMCAIIDQEPLLAERRTLQQRNAQLLASEKRLEAVINASMDAIISVDKAMRITVFNPTAAALFACSAEDALGSPLARFLPEVAASLPLSHITTQALLGEMQAHTASGQRVAVEVSVAFEPDGTSTTVFARDLTSRKRSAAPWKPNCAKHTKCRRWAPWPGALRTTSTTSSAQSWATWNWPKPIAATSRSFWTACWKLKKPAAAPVIWCGKFSPLAATSPPPAAPSTHGTPSKKAKNSCAWACPRRLSWRLMPRPICPPCWPTRPRSSKPCST